MKLKRLIALCLLFSTLLLLASAHAASLTGKWKGSANVSGMPFALTVHAEFKDDGTYELTTTGLTAKGSYQVDGGSLTISVSDLSGLLSSMLADAKDIPSISLPLTLSDTKLSLSGEAHGMSASLSMDKQ